MENSRTTSQIARTCYHCGDTIRGEQVDYDTKAFCCSGCKLVYEILNQNNLCQYYSIEKNPGIQPSSIESSRFDYLDDAEVQRQILHFSDGKHAKGTFTLPSIHCSSCIWLLEHLYSLDPGITSSRVDFLKKQIAISFDQEKTSLKKIIVLLSSIGYEPDLRLESVKKNTDSARTRTLYYKIGIAGFCFGNSMMFSFPEYLGVSSGDVMLKEIFSYLNLVLGIPVFFYCAGEYFVSAWGGLRKKIINIDVPIAIGVTLLFGRSIYEILSQTGPGFIDSLCGLVFFLLLGKVFQSKTYDRLNFERTYKSYFPISVTTKRNGMETTIPISSLAKHQRIVIRNNEIIPADSLLLMGNASIDYSFVTGESVPVQKVLGEIIYAGGRQVGSVIELEVIKDVSQSYLTQLWNQFKGGHREEGNLSELSNTVSKYFTISILAVSSAVGVYWLQYDTLTAINAFTGMMIVACPCALAISIPFTLGSALRIFGMNGFYLININVVESLAKVNTIVFDKTGTLTYPQRSSCSFVGMPLSDEEKTVLYSVTRNSIHPFSRIISEWLAGEPRSVDLITEDIGKGIRGTVDGKEIRIGSHDFVGSSGYADIASDESRVYCSIDQIQRGYFSIRSVYREGMEEVITSLRNQYQFAVVSGDNESERNRLESVFPENTALHFNQMPVDKLTAVKELQRKNARVLVVGDGLNDAGALLQSDVGIAVTENVAHFTPASDAILAGEAFHKIPKFLQFAKTNQNIVKASFLFAFLYNIIGLYFAVQGSLSPIIAAILMPLSSITIVLIATVSTRISAKAGGLLT